MKNFITKVGQNILWLVGPILKTALATDCTNYDVVIIMYIMY